MKPLRLFSLLAVLLSSSLTPATAQTDNLDPSFAEDGVLRPLPAPVGDLEIQADGKIVWLGSLGSQSTVVRVTAAGQLDSTFGGGDGFTVLPQGRGTNGHNGLAIDDQGRILVVVAVQSSPDGSAGGLARLLPDGSLDETFGEAGFTQPLGTRPQTGFSDVATAPDGRIVAVGRARKALLVARFTEEGELDSTFSHDGVRYVSLQRDLGGSLGLASASAEAVSVLSSGKIVIMGGQGAATVLQFKQGGALDPTFGPTGDGSTFVRVDPGDFQSSDGAVQPGGGILVAGLSGDAGDWTVTRFRRDGSLDDRFANGGTARIEGSNASPPSMAIDHESGVILLAGMMGENDTRASASLYALNPRGSARQSFGTAGRIELDLDGERQSKIGFTSVAIQDDGRVVAGGLIEFSEPFIVRFLPVP